MAGRRGKAKAGAKATPDTPPMAPNKYLQGMPGLVTLAGMGMR